MHILEHKVIRVFNAHGTTVGTGFVVADHLAVTCAHVVQAAGSACGQPISIEFYSNGKKDTVQVLHEGWSPPANNDMALLRLNNLPEGVTPVVMGSATRCQGHPYFSFGFAKLAGYDNRPVNGIIDGLVSVRDSLKRDMLQLQGEAIDQGLSGAPVLDTKTGRVIGMVSEYQDNEQTRFAWSTTADTLALALSILDPSFCLWPETFGQRERDLYLRYLIDTNQRLQLPDGYEVQLERIYVSLRASEMQAAEWEAEQALYLNDMEAMRQAARAASSEDLYTEFKVVSRVIARHPKALKLTARDWETLFSTHEKGPLSLAEVVQRHRHVVILGDPGSGKTTLSRWLALQYARAMLQQETRVQVRADLVKPGARSEMFLDLGPVCLPLLVRIADYAQARWTTEDGDTHLPLERFLGHHEKRQDRPADLTQDVIQSIVWHYLGLGQALVILDGLDEVADPDRRRLIMQEVKRFLQGPTSAIDLPARLWAENLMLLTSRIVGYQFEPLADLPHCTIEDMDEPAITAFCEAWMRHVPLLHLDTETAISHSQALKSAIFQHAHPGVRALASNPLLLTLLAQVYWNSQHHILPASRVALFEDVTRLMYDQRERFWDRSAISPLRLNRALGAIAVHIHTSEPTGFTDEGGVRKALRSVLRDSEQVEAVLEAAREVSGFLVARGPGVYGFVHRSLQEYFVALHLTDCASVDAEATQRMIDQLAAYALDPGWREPIVLAVGIISHVKHPENKELGRMLKALLDAADPAGTVLPRRELLVAAACTECDRVPQAIGHRIAEHLLACYAEREGRGRSPVIRERIQQAFQALQRCPAPIPYETEAILCAAIECADFDWRSAAIDLLIESRWDTPATASALVTSWKTYADPAGSILSALESIQTRHPEYFAPIAIPLRQQKYAWAWEKAQRSRKWRAILRILYLSPEAPFSPEQVNRDSPLTEQVLAALYQTIDGRVPATLRHDLVSLTEHPGTARARDAALILSTLDDTNWIKQSVIAVNGQARLLQATCAALAYFLALDFDRTLTFDIVIAFGKAGDLASAVDIDSARDLASGLANALAHARGSARALTRARDRVKNHGRACDFARAFDFVSEYDYDLDLDYDHAITRPPDLDSNPGLGSTLDLISPLASVAALARDIQQARQRWAEDAVIVERLDTAMSLIRTLQHLYQLVEPQASAFVLLCTAFNELHSLQRQQVKTELEQGDKSMTLKALAGLVNDLGSMNDAKREHASQVLIRNQDASLLGKPIIDRMATLAHKYRTNAQIGTILGWALNHIMHDVPDWMESWIEQASKSEQASSVLTILNSIERVTPETFHILMKRLPHTPFTVKRSLLKSMSSLVRLNELPELAQKDFSQNLLDWIDEELDGVQRTMMIEALGNWQEKETAKRIAQALLRILADEVGDQKREIRALTTSLARLATIQPEIRRLVKAALSRESVRSTALPALVRLRVAEIRRKKRSSFVRRHDKDKKRASIQKAGTSLQAYLVPIIPDPACCFDALLDAGTDDDPWDDDYHSVLVVAVQKQVEQFPKLVPMLLARLEHALDQEDWPAQRIILAAVAACTESLPAKLQQAAHGKLEALLVRGTTDIYSFNSRRHALTALSYLRTVTPAVVPALLTACRDVELVQQDAIAAARRFQEIQGNVLSDLAPWLIGESVTTAYAVAQLFGALGTSVGSEATGMREQIVKALVEALQNPDCRRMVVIKGENKGTLEDVLFTALLKIEGWVA
jgi:hypothetical protein